MIKKWEFHIGRKGLPKKVYKDDAAFHGTAEEASKILKRLVQAYKEHGYTVDSYEAIPKE